jgi:hypothetical protein
VECTSTLQTKSSFASLAEICPRPINLFFILGIGVKVTGVHFLSIEAG